MKPNKSLRILATSIATFIAAQSVHGANVTWNVAGAGTWDAATANWIGGNPDPNLFVNGDDATFNNAAGGVITVSASIAPSSTTVSATTGTYTFQTNGITSGTLTKVNNGVLTLNVANTHSGLTDVRGGILNYGTANALGTGNILIGPRSADVGYARLDIGVNSDTVGTVTVDGEGRLIGTTGVLTSTGSFEMKRGFASAILSGSGINLNKTTGGLFVLTNANTYTGTTTVSKGVLRLSNASALSGGILNTGGTSALTINGGTVELTSASGDFLRNLGAGSDQFRITGGVSGFSANGAARIVTVNNDANQELVWGSSDFNPSTLVLNDSTANNTLTLTNKIDLNGASRTVGSFIATTGVSLATMSGVIRNSAGTAAGIEKVGVGWVSLNGINTYDGATNVNRGVLQIQNADALGSTAAGTVVSSGASLHILNNITTAAEALTINGTGVVDGYNNIPTEMSGFVIIGGQGTTTLNNAGALRSISGNNIYSGAVTLGSKSKISSDTAANTLTLSGGVTGTDTDLIVGGVGDTTITAITTGTGSLTTHANATTQGTLNLTGASTYTGATNIRGNIINLTGSLNGSTGTALNFIGQGTFKVTDTSQNMGALNVYYGDATVRSSRTGAGTLTQTFPSFVAPDHGGGRGVTFITDGGTIGTDNKITFTAAPATGFMGKNVFANSVTGVTSGDRYAAYDAGGFVRAYGSGDADYLDAPTNSTIGASDNSKNVDLSTGNITAQITASANTITMRNNSIAMTGTSAVLSTNGLLSSGSAGATIGGGTTPRLQAEGAGGELVVRVNGSTDLLTISSIIQNNTSSSRLTKLGAGTLSITTAVTYTGRTHIAGGTLKATPNLILATSKDVVVDSAIWDANGGQAISLGTAANPSNNSIIVRNGGAIKSVGTIEFATDAAASNNSITITGIGTRIESSGNNTALFMRLGDNNTLTIADGAHLRLNGGNGTTNSKIGESLGADGNSLVVTGAGSTFSHSGQRLVIGNLGGTMASPNTMLISDGGQVITRVSHIGGESTGVASGSYNKVTVTGANSLWSMTETMTVGAGISTNNGLLISNGGTVFTKSRSDRSGAERPFYVGFSAGSNANYITITGAGSKLVADNGNSNIGTTTGLTTSFIGVDAASNDNVVNVQDGGLLNVNGRLELGGINSALNLGDGTAKSYASLQDVVFNTASGRVNVNNGEFKFNRDSTAVSGLGEFALLGDAFVKTDFTNSIAVAVTGVGNFSKQGTGTLTLSSVANSYVGDTRVNTGTLSISSGYLDDSSDVYVESGSIFNLNFAGSDTIDALSLDGNIMAAGDWGSTASGATNINDTYFSGTGILTVGSTMVPEPGAAVSLLGGLGILLGLRRRRS